MHSGLIPPLMRKLMGTLKHRDGRARVQREVLDKMLAGALAGVLVVASPTCANLTQASHAATPSISSQPFKAGQSDSISNGHPALSAHPALWKISQGPNILYLFGTIHILPKGVTWFGGPLAHAFTSSDELVTEIIEPDTDAMSKLVLAKAILPSDQHLQTMLTTGDRRMLARALSSSGLPAQAFDHFQPWYAAVAISMLPLMHAGYKPDDGVDSRLSERAKTMGLAHEALETPEFQLNLFASLPQPVQRRYLHDVLTELPTMNHELAKMIAAWKLGDAAMLARLMNEDEDEPHMRDLLLTRRNQRWAQWIHHYLDTHNTGHHTLFIAVGAGHLAGSQSLIAQLAAMGIRARRIE